MSALLSTRDVARMMKVTETTIKRWADEEHIPCVKTVGGHRKFATDDIIAFARYHDYPVTGVVPPSKILRDVDQLEFNVQSKNFARLADVVFRQALEGDKESLYEFFSYVSKHTVSLVTISDEIIRPAMAKIGEQWANGKLEINQEHLALNAVLEALARFAPELHRKPSNGMTAVAAAAEGELHELGLRLLTYALECEGWKVQSLGGNTPYETLCSFVKTTRPQLVCLSSTRATALKGLRKGCRIIGRTARSANTVFVLGGISAAGLSPRDFFCDHCATSVGDALAFIKDRFQLRPGPKKKKKR